jgi:hypothetical protein
VEEGGGIPNTPLYHPYAEDASPDRAHFPTALPLWYGCLASKSLPWYVPGVLIHGTAMTQSKLQPIKMTLEAELLERLDKLVPMVGQSAAAREFGINVDRHLVARVALLRGLSAMEAAIPEKSPESAPESGVAPPPALVLPAIPVESESLKADPGSEPAVTADIGDDGLVVAPDGWNSWSKSERVPLEQQKVHEYYESGGLSRYWGRSGEEVIAFYWSPDPSLHDFPSYKLPDTSGKEIKVQTTPYGPGHMVPHGWSE